MTRLWGGDRNTALTIGWLGQEVGCTLRPRARLSEVLEDGPLDLPREMDVRLRGGKVVTIGSSLLCPEEEEELYWREEEEEQDGEEQEDGEELYWSDSDQEENDTDRGYDYESEEEMSDRLPPQASATGQWWWGRWGRWWRRGRARWRGRRGAWRRGRWRARWGRPIITVEE